MADPDNIADAIEQAAIEGIQRVTGDQGSIEIVPIKDQIEADRYTRSVRAAAAGGFGGIKFVRFVPPGADGD